MAIKPMVNTIPPMNDGASKCRQGWSGAGFTVVDVAGAGVVEVVVEVVVVFGAGWNWIKKNIYLKYDLMIIYVFIFGY